MQPKRMTGEEKEWEFLEEGSFPRGVCEGRGQRSVSTV